MSSKQSDVRNVATRVAEEAQLLAEERWLMDSLKKIKKQYNSLQIERLNLESLYAEELAKRQPGGKNKPSSPNYNKACTEGPGSSLQPPLQVITVPNAEPANADMNWLDEPSICNTQKLNLDVGDYFYGLSNCTEDPTQEEDEDDEDTFDMNFFMHDENS